MIINIIEHVFWCVAFFLMASSGNRGCKAAACVLGGLLATLAALLWYVVLFTFLSTRSQPEVLRIRVGEYELILRLAFCRLSLPLSHSRNSGSLSAIRLAQASCHFRNRRDIVVLENQCNWYRSRRHVAWK